MGGWRCLFQEHVSCKSRSPGDDWEMAGWLAIAISKDFGCNLGSLEDGWEMAGRWLGEHLLYENTQYNTLHQYNNNTPYSINEN